jgi:hypothetical protein
MTVAEWIESRPKWTYIHELDVVNTINGVSGTIYAIVAPARLRRGRLTPAEWSELRRRLTEEKP